MVVIKTSDLVVGGKFARDQELVFVPWQIALDQFASSINCFRGDRITDDDVTLLIQVMFLWRTEMGLHWTLAA